MKVLSKQSNQRYRKELEKKNTGKMESSKSTNSTVSQKNQGEYHNAKNNS